MLRTSSCSVIALITISFCVAGMVSAQTAITTATSTVPVVATTTVMTVATTTVPVVPVPTIPMPVNVHNATQVESQVRAAFTDAPVMIDIARCESKFRQFADSGNVFMGGTNRRMVGIFQIYSDVHRATAVSLGMDIDTVAGNIAYARYLYNRQRTAPWLDSMSCWNPNPVEGSTGSAPVPQVFSSTLSFGSNNGEVLTLQKILNTHGFVIAASGAGSPGNETTLFGGLTRTAVRAFQCAKNIVCSGDEYTTSYGVVGPRTRAALTQLVAGGPIATPVPTPVPPAPAPNPAPAPVDNSAAIAALKAQISSLQQQISVLEAAQR